MIEVLRRPLRPCTVLVAVLAATAVLAGCIGAVDRDEFEAELVERGGGLQPDAAITGLAALRSAVGADDPPFARITFDPPLVTYWVVDAGDDGQVEAWRWDGSDLTGPSSVPAEATADVGDRTFAVDDVPALDRIDEVSDAAVRAVDLDGGVASGVLVAHRGADLRIVVAVRSDQSRRHAVFLTDGELERVEGG